MKIACIGTGFVGVVTSAVFAKLGNQVVGLDIDEKKIESLRQGIVPFYEPDLSELLVETQKPAISPLLPITVRVSKIVISS